MVLSQNFPLTMSFYREGQRKAAKPAFWPIPNQLQTPLPGSRLPPEPAPSRPNRGWWFNMCRFCVLVVMGGIPKIFKSSNSSSRMTIRRHREVTHGAPLGSYWSPGHLSSQVIGGEVGLSQDGASTNKTGFQPTKIRRLRILRIRMEICELWRGVFKDWRLGIHQEF